MYALAIWKPGNDGFVCGAHVGHGGSSLKKVTCCTGVKDGHARMAAMSILTVLRSAAEASAYFGVGVRQC